MGRHAIPNTPFMPSNISTIVNIISTESKALISIIMRIILDSPYSIPHALASARKLEIILVGADVIQRVFMFVGRQAFCVLFHEPAGSANILRLVTILWARDLI